MGAQIKFEENDGVDHTPQINFEEHDEAELRINNARNEEAELCINNVRNDEAEDRINDAILDFYKTLEKNSMR